MDEKGLEEIRRQAAKVVQSDCSDYGVYGNVILHQPSPFTRSGDSNRNRLYVVAGLSPSLSEDPPPKWLEPEKLLRRQQQNNKLFYPDTWIFDLSGYTSDIEVREALIEYAKRAEFLSVIYAMYGVEIPERLRLSEVNTLMSFYDKYLEHSANPRIQRRYQKDLDWFFRREKTKNRFRKKWLAYFRSDHFPDKNGISGVFPKLTGFLRRKEPEISRDQLMKINGSICTLQMQEQEFQQFRRYMSRCHPDISYAIGDSEIVDHGVTPKHARNQVTVQNVTWEEYAAIRLARFAEEGYAALSNLNPSYWEFRDVYYRAIDAPVIASVYNNISLQYAKCNALDELEKYGPICIEDIPAVDFMNFVSLAKANGIRFYIDNRGDFAIPSLDTIHVVYNKFQSDKMAGILGRMIGDKVTHSHSFSEESAALDRRIEAGQLETLHGTKREAVKHLESGHLQNGR